MAEVSLKVIIAGRTYPLIVKQEEEKKVIEVAKTINDKIKEFEQNYSVRDKQDLLAMCALNLLTSQQNTSNKSLETDKDLINQLDLFVSEYLQKQA
jgi:cell division protein ZapA (FtsZ GTPase activity inhibitor)